MTRPTMLISLGTLALAGCGNCIRSVETPDTVGTCVDGSSGPVCVQEVEGPNNSASTYVRSVDFVSPTVELDVSWCADGSCSNGSTQGRALLVVVDHNDGEQTVLVANCQTPQIQQTVHDVDQIEIMTAPNLSDENTVCGGNEVLSGGFGRWEICEPNLAEEAPIERVFAGGLARVTPATGLCERNAAARRTAVRS